MMNPAAELLAIFDGWQMEKVSPEVARHMGNPDAAGESDHRRAMRCLVELESLILRFESDGRNVEMYRSGLTSWTRVVLSYPVGWQGKESAARNGFAKAKREVLAAMADLLEQNSFRVNDQAIGELDQFLVSVKTLAQSDHDLSAQLREFVTELALSIERAVARFRVTGVFDADAELRMLWVALKAAEAESKQRSSVWRDLAVEIVGSTVGGILVNVSAVLGLTALVRAAIG